MNSPNVMVVAVYRASLYPIGKQGIPNCRGHARQNLIIAESLRPDRVPRQKSVIKYEILKSS